MSNPSCGASACKLSQPIEEKEIDGLTVGNWTNHPIYTANKFYDVSLDHDYDVTKTELKTRMPNEAYLTMATATAQGTFLEFVDGAGNPAVTTSNTVRVYCSGGSEYRSNIDFDVATNKSWKVQYLRTDLALTSSNAIQTYTFSAQAVKNLESSTPVSLQFGRLIRGDGSGVWIQSIRKLGTNESPLIQVRYVQQGTGTCPLIVQLVSYEG